MQALAEACRNVTPAARQIYMDMGKTGPSTRLDKPQRPLVANGYISNLKTLKSVSVSASVTVINSQTIKVGIRKPENRQITDIATDLP